jgi:hypothetical protein
MPRQAQPHYEEKRNQWYIYVNYQKKYLCSGKGNWAEALSLATAAIWGCRENSFSRLMPAGWSGPQM